MLIANVPRDHAGRGGSFCIAILLNLLYRGRVGGESSRDIGLVKSIVELHLIDRI